MFETSSPAFLLPSCAEPLREPPRSPILPLETDSTSDSSLESAGFVGLNRSANVAPPPLSPLRRVLRRFAFGLGLGLGLALLTGLGLRLRLRLRLHERLRLRLHERRYHRRL